MVPQDKVARLRMKLAEGGLPKGGGVGYEIFDKSDALGATSFIQNINHLRALEGELVAHHPLASTGCRPRACIWCCPTAPLFSRDKIEATASIVLKVRGQLEPQTGARHPPSGGDRGQRHEAGARLGDRRDRQAARRRRRRQRLRHRRRRRRAQDRLREPPAPARSRPSSPRWSARATRACRSTPISTSTASPRPRTNSIRTAAWCARARRARSNPRPARPGRRPGFGQQRTARRQSRKRRRRQSRDQNKKTEEIVNYEVSRTTKTEVIEAGRVNRISAAVLVDGTYAKNDKGEVVYKPRSKEEIDRIAALVRSAIGFDAKRGDQVEVVNLRFAETPPVPIERAGRLDELSAIHQRRHHARRQSRRHGPARPHRAVHGGAAAGAPDHHAEARQASMRRLQVRRRCRRRRRHRWRPASRWRRHHRERSAAAAASPTAAAPTSRSSAATNPSPSPTAPPP